MKTINVSITALLICTASLLASAGAHAQATIDQNKALSGSVTPGDAPGFPVTLSIPGSYKLTGNLVVPGGMTGIEITASGVTLDLNGFSVSGPLTCTRNDVTFDVTCTGTPGVNGIAMMGGGNTVRNGRVRGFSTGIYYAGGDQIDGILVEQNGSGMGGPTYDGARTQIRNSRAQFNSSTGISLSDATAQGCTAGGNGGAGFSGTRSVVLDSVSFRNKTLGFQGNTFAIGRSVAQGNKGGEVGPGITSLGNNLSSFTTVF